MIDDDWHKQTNTYQTVYNTKQPGKSPNDISNDKTNEIYSMLATPLKNMRYKVMKDAAANCFKDKWMDEAYPTLTKSSSARLVWRIATWATSTKI